MKEILAKIEKETQRQDAKWGVRTQHPSTWSTIFGEEWGEVSKEICEGNFDTAQINLRNYETELIQCGAVICQMIKDIENYKKEKQEPKSDVEITYHYYTYRNIVGDLEKSRSGKITLRANNIPPNDAIVSEAYSLQDCLSLFEDGVDEWFAAADKRSNQDRVRGIGNQHHSFLPPNIQIVKSKEHKNG